jgi:hypothetical protein
MGRHPHRPEHVQCAASYGPSYNWSGYSPGVAATSTPVGEPTPVTGTDSFTLSSLPAGSYIIWVQVALNQHKPGATYTFNYPPMSLAMNSRDGTGAYQIGSFTHRRAAQMASNGSV